MLSAILYSKTSKKCLLSPQALQLTLLLIGTFRAKNCLNLTSEQPEKLCRLDSHLFASCRTLGPYHFFLSNARGRLNNACGHVMWIPLQACMMTFCIIDHTDSHLHTSSASILHTCCGTRHHLAIIGSVPSFLDTPLSVKLPQEANGTKIFPFLRKITRT